MTSLLSFHHGDLTQVLELLRWALPAHHISENLFTHKVLLDPDFDPETALVSKDEQGNVAGFVLGVSRKSRPIGGAADSRTGWITLFAVRADRRRRSVATRMFDAVETRLRERGITEIRISPYTPNYWTPGVDESAYPAAVEFLKQRGYVVTSRPLAMAADLRAERPSRSDWVERRQSELQESFGLQIQTIRPAGVLPLMGFLEAEFPGDWERHVRETLIAIYSGYRSAEDIFVATSGAEVCGFSHADGERFGPFGVSACRRGMGVGAVLLHRSLQSMRQRGVDRAWFMWTGDDAARRIYAPAGFVETIRFSVMCKVLQ